MTQCKTCRQVRLVANSVLDKVGLPRFKFSVGEKQRDLTFFEQKGVKDGSKKV
jgi:hypothetical protein